MKSIHIFYVICIFAFLLGLGLSGCSCGDDDDDDSGNLPDDDDTADDDDTGDDDDTADDDDDDDDDDMAFAEWRDIDHGSFTMGSPASETGRKDDETQHDVALTNDFELMSTEVTQEKFTEIMGYNPSHFPLVGENLSLPVDSVSWFDALAFANLLSEDSGYSSCYTLSNILCADETAGDTTSYCKDNGGIYSADVAVNSDTVYACEGFRLPTESEWEYATRAGTSTAFFTGDITVPQCTPADPNLDSVAWFCGNADKKNTNPVATKTPNDWGVYDTYGNVAEWVWDWYGQTYPGDTTDPTGPADGSFRVTRGGAFRYDGALRCRSAARTGKRPVFRSWYLGFRVVRTLSGTKGEGLDFRVEKQPVEKSSGQKDYPDELPFDFERPDVGTPLTPTEIADFTETMTSFFKNTGYFHWLLQVSQGMSETNPDGMPPYKLFYGGKGATKSGDVITFTQYGFEDNLTIPTSKFFNNIGALYLASGDQTLGRLVEQYAKGYVALFLGMMWDTDERDPEKYILARDVFPRNNTQIEEGREAYINYDPVRVYSYDWNAHTLPNPNNPYFGDETWVRTWRSKDDVPHIYRTFPVVQRLVEEAPDQYVKDAVTEMHEYLKEFAKDTTDSGWYIRTKEDGDVIVPVDEHGIVVDLASYVNYTFILPTAECSGRETSALIGYGDPLDTACTNGIGWGYELVATFGNDYNYDIVRYFHVAEITNALMNWETGRAEDLLAGMVTRVEYMLYTDPFRTQYDWWEADSSSFLLAAATAGLPLTSEEAQLVYQEYSKAAEWYLTWTNWDLWDASVPDGAVEWRPSRQAPAGPVVNLDEVSFIFEYCWSPFRNEASAPLIDCDVVLDPTQW